MKYKYLYKVSINSFLQYSAIGIDSSGKASLVTIDEDVFNAIRPEEAQLDSFDHFFFRNCLTRVNPFF